MSEVQRLESAALIAQVVQLGFFVQVYPPFEFVQTAFVSRSLVIDVFSSNIHRRSDTPPLTTNTPRWVADRALNWGRVPSNWADSVDCLRFDFSTEIIKKVLGFLLFGGNL